MCKNNTNRESIEIMGIWIAHKKMILTFPILGGSKIRRTPMWSIEKFKGKTQMWTIESFKGNNLRQIQIQSHNRIGPRGEQRFNRISLRGIEKFNKRSQPKGILNGTRRRVLNKTTWTKMRELKSINRKWLSYRKKWPSYPKNWRIKTNKLENSHQVMKIK